MLHVCEVSLPFDLTAHVVGPINDTDRIEGAGTACLVPVHPAVGHAVPGLDRRNEGGRDICGSDVLDGRGDRETREEDGEEGYDNETDGWHHGVSWLPSKISGCLYV